MPSSAAPARNTPAAKVRVPAAPADATKGPGLDWASTSGSESAALCVLGDWFFKHDSRNRGLALHHPKVDAAVESCRGPV